MKQMKRLLPVLLALVGLVAVAQPADWSFAEDKLNFYVANDLGRNGYYDQKPIAELMGTLAETIGPEFVLAAGDVHHFEGVRSVDDPLWMTNFELIYSHPELMIDWFPLLGNHEYRGNTQAVLDYTQVSRRWTMPARRKVLPCAWCGLTPPPSSISTARMWTNTPMQASRTCRRS